MKMSDKIKRRISCSAGILMAMAAMTVTSCIDEDLSRCGQNYRIDYTVRLRTNIDTEISDELTTANEQAFGVVLRSALSNVFTDVAQNIDLSFYSDNSLAHHETQQMDASTSSFTIYLPVQEYQHLALANTAVEPLVDISGADSDLTLAMVQQSGDTISSQSVGLFSARLPMAVEDRDQVFNVDLYMQNCAVALVIDRDGQSPTAVWGYVRDLATSFSVNDSIYSYENMPFVRANLISDSNYYGLYAASFPSQDETRASDDAAIWRFEVYITLNGSTTKSTLSVSEPLQAGDLKIIKARIADDGRIVTTASDVGVSVTLDWKEGGSHDIEV